MSEDKTNMTAGTNEKTAQTTLTGRTPRTGGKDGRAGKEGRAEKTGKSGREEKTMNDRTDGTFGTDEKQTHNKTLVPWCLGGKIDPYCQNCVAYSEEQCKECFQETLREIEEVSQ